MIPDVRVCSVCAWREDCRKKFITPVDTFCRVHCPDYTRDVRIKDDEIGDAAFFEPLQAEAALVLHEVERHGFSETIVGVYFLRVVDAGVVPEVDAQRDAAGLRLDGLQ